LIKIDENIFKMDKQTHIFYNNKIYISQLILTSQIMNEIIMNDLKNTLLKLLIENKIIHEFRKAPIKKNVKMSRKNRNRLYE